MSNVPIQAPLPQRAKKWVEKWVTTFRLDKAFRRAPLVITLILLLLGLGSVVGSLLQVLTIWEYPPHMWTKTIVLEHVKDGLWKWLFTYTYFNPDGIGFFSFLYVFILGTTTWLFSTKVKQLRHLFTRYLVFAFANLILFSKWIVWASVPVKTMWTPWVAEIMVPYLGKTPYMDKFLADNVTWFTWGVLFLPIYAVYFFAAWFAGLLMEHEEKWNEWFSSYEFQHHAIEHFKEMQREGVYPDTPIGVYVDSAGKIKAIMRGKDRATHTIVVGSIGTGKSAAALLPLIRWDFKHLVNYINNFQTDEYAVRSQRLSGMTIIDPSDDLCSKSYQLAKAHGLPDEAIFYLNPEYEHSKSYNPLRGPAETVAATFVFVLEGLQPDQEDFYKNTQAVHLYNHILLLKLLHDGRDEIERIIRTQRPTYPDPLIPTNSKPYLTYEQIFGSNQCTLDTLMKMYRDPWLVKQASRSLSLLLPDQWESRFTGDKLSYYSIIEQVISFINKVVDYKRTFKGEVILYVDGPHAGEIEVIDTYAEKITGLTNVLNQMAANTYFRRVMFGDSGLDLDVLLRTGGVLLINTADGIMGKLSKYFAQIMLQSMVQAVYRRDISKGQPHGHHIIVDEFPKYAYETYADFPANSRKYGAFITIGMQTMAQMEMKFSKAYLETIIGVHRNRMVYQGVPLLDAEYFSRYFGTKKIYQVSEGRNYQPSTQDTPGMSQSEKYTLVEVPRFAPHEISESKAYEAVLQLNIDNEQQPARRVKADFVPKSEFKDAKEKPSPKALQAWIEQIKYEAENGPAPVGKYVSGLIDQEARDYLTGKDVTYSTDVYEEFPPKPVQVSKENTRNRGSNPEIARSQNDRARVDNPVSNSESKSLSSKKTFDFSLPPLEVLTEPEEIPLGKPEPQFPQVQQEMDMDIAIPDELFETALELERIEGEETRRNLPSIEAKRISTQSLREQRERIAPGISNNQRISPRSMPLQPGTKQGRVTGNFVRNNVIEHEENRRKLEEEARRNREELVAQRRAIAERQLIQEEPTEVEEIPNPFTNVDLTNLMPAPAPKQSAEEEVIEETTPSSPIRSSQQGMNEKTLLAESFQLAPEPPDTEQLLKTFVADALASTNQRKRKGIGGEEE